MGKYSSPDKSGNWDERNPPPHSSFGDAERWPPGFEPHPLAAKYPLIGRWTAEMKGLVADIKAHGLKEQIVMLGGMVLDGRNRVRALVIAGVAITADMVRQFGSRPSDGNDPAAFVISVNEHRRHLTHAQRVVLADAEAPGKHGGERGQVPNLQLDKTLTLEEVAKKRGVSVGSIEQWRKAKEKVGEKLAERIAADIHKGSVRSVNQASAISEMPRHEAAAELDKLEMFEGGRNRDPHRPRKKQQRRQPTEAFVGSTKVTADAAIAFAKVALDSERSAVAVAHFNAIRTDAEKLKVDEVVGAWSRRFTEENER
jgi:hypothetical protein